MFIWDDVKNPGEIKRYAFDWSAELGSDPIVSASATLVPGRDAGLTLIIGTQFDGNLSFVKLSGGVAGETAQIKGVITTANETFEEVGELRIVEAFNPATLPLDDLRADLAALKKARVEMLTGSQIKEVWRDGRRITFNVASVGDITKAIAEYDGLIANAEYVAVGKRRFRALRPVFN